jgi:hypothetical protein
MNVLILFTFLSVTAVDYMTQIGLLPKFAKLLPDAMSFIALLLVFVYGARNRFGLVRPAYWFVFCAMGATILCGIVANSVDAGPLISGMRRYLKAIPFFFLPIVYAFSQKQIRAQLFFLTALCLPQIPISFSQRSKTIYEGGFTGDATTGMFSTSGFLSIFLVSAACVLTGMLLRRRIRLVWFLPLFLLILTPTMINETKATVILLPIGLLVTFLAASRGQERFKNLVMATALLAMFGAIFIPVYDYYINRKGGPTIADFYTNPEKFEHYMSKDSTTGTRDVKDVGRVDALVTPLRDMANDPAKLAFGLGVGNASNSPLGLKFAGDYYERYKFFLKSAASNFLLEIGILGLLLVLLTSYLVYRDARIVADTDEGITGALAAGWAGVTAVIAVSLFYKNITTSEAITYTFWFFSGTVAAQRVRLARQTEHLEMPTTSSLARVRA